MRGVFGLALALSVAACASADGTSQPAERRPVPEPAAQQAPGHTPPQTPDEATAFAEFTKRIAAYMELHNRLEATLPKKPEETTPEVINRHQHALTALLQRERKNAKVGDIFGPPVAPVFRSVLAKVFGGPDGKQLRSSIMDENPIDAKLSINARYPDQVPLSTVPPQVLAALPKLPTELEFRFVGNRLILLDIHAHTIVDYLERALP